MTRVLHFRNFGVFVGDERGVQHHSPHCHVKHRGQRIASVHLLTLEVLNQIVPIPADLMDLIADNQDQLIAEWERLNP